MRRHEDTPVSRRRRPLLLIGGATLAAGLLSGCGEDARRGWLPRGATEGADVVTNFWVGTWIAALAVGVLVWGLTIWCIVAYRRKKDEVGLPEQLRYNVPIEILYTVLPIMMIGVIFYYTARYETVLVDTSQEPDVRINVVAKQWSWDFNYVDSGVWESGVQAQLTGAAGVERTLPDLYLPAGKRVEFVLTARDVIHSFWVPAFQQKMDMIPGKVNRFQVVTKDVGTFQGKCAELCGAYHATMLFNVKVVPQNMYDQQMAALRAKGQTGVLGTEGLSRSQLVPAEKSLDPKVSN